jgi:hypothetical protein
MVRMVLCYVGSATEHEGRLRSQQIVTQALLQIVANGAPHRVRPAPFGSDEEHEHQEEVADAIPPILGILLQQVARRCPDDKGAN